VLQGKGTVATCMDGLLSYRSKVEGAIESARVAGRPVIICRLSHPYQPRAADIRWDHLNAPYLSNVVVPAMNRIRELARG
jgi:hypothetical protein